MLSSLPSNTKITQHKGNHAVTSLLTDELSVNRRLIHLNPDKIVSNFSAPGVYCIQLGNCSQRENINCEVIVHGPCFDPSISNFSVKLERKIIYCNVLINRTNGYV